MIETQRLSGRGGTASQHDGTGFLTLPLIKDRVDEPTLLTLLASKEDISRKLYEPSTLRSQYRPWRHIVDEVTFEEVSFSKTDVELFEFNNCTFRRCLFIGTIFRDCRFAGCEFIDCNPFRIQFLGCFADPSQFDSCLPHNDSANLGVHLFQQLLLNSRQQAQPDFADEAQFRFRRWQHRQLRTALPSKVCTRGFWKKVPGYVLAVLFDVTCGSGMRLKRLLSSSALFIAFVSLLNWLCAAPLGLKLDQQVIDSPVDAFYFTAVVMTTLGFGDVTPHTHLGRLAVGLEAISGFVLFAFLTSTLYRRLSS
jgi:hypothetical protein